MANTEIKQNGRELRGLTLVLVNEGLITPERVKTATEEAAQEGTPLVSYLLRKKAIGPREVAVASASAYGLPLLDLKAVDTTTLPRELVSQQLIRRHRSPSHRGRGADLGCGRYR